jgi:hypothetical protein
MAKAKRKTSKELAKSIGKFLKGKKTNKDNKEQFERAVKRSVQRGSK